MTDFPYEKERLWVNEEDGPGPDDPRADASWFMAVEEAIHQGQTDEAAQEILVQEGEPLPTDCKLWVDLSESPATLKYHDGNGWVTLTGAGSSGGGGDPGGGESGEFYTFALAANGEDAEVLPAQYEGVGAELVISEAVNIDTIYLSNLTAGSEYLVEFGFAQSETVSGGPFGTAAIQTGGIVLGAGDTMRVNVFRTLVNTPLSYAPLASVTSHEAIGLANLFFYPFSDEPVSDGTAVPFITFDYTLLA